VKALAPATVLELTLPSSFGGFPSEAAGLSRLSDAPLARFGQYSFFLGASSSGSRGFCPPDQRDGFIEACFRGRTPPFCAIASEACGQPCAIAPSFEPFASFRAKHRWLSFPPTLARAPYTLGAALWWFGTPPFATIDREGRLSFFFLKSELNFPLQTVRPGFFFSASASITPLSRLQAQDPDGILQRLYSPSYPPPLIEWFGDKRGCAAFLRRRPHFGIARRPGQRAGP